MTKRFGFGYEEDSTDSPSIQTARCYFLELIPELRPSVMWSLLRDAYQPFCELLANNKSVITSICESVEAEMPKDPIVRQPKNIREQAIKKFVSNWHSLELIEGADSLHQALQDWARGQNLTDDWCLDHALAFFRDFAGADEKNMAVALLPDMDYLLHIV